MDPHNMCVSLNLPQKYNFLLDLAILSIYHTNVLFMLLEIQEVELWWNYHIDLVTTYYAISISDR